MLHVCPELSGYLLYANMLIYNAVRYKHGHLVDQNIFQEWISAFNYVWKEYTKELKQAETSSHLASENINFRGGIDYNYDTRDSKLFLLLR